MADRPDDTRTIPVTEEELLVGRRTVDVGTVRISKTSETKQVIVDDPIVVEEVQIERRRIDQPVSSTEPPLTRTEGDTTIFPVLEEIVVVEKRLMLREEIRVRRIRQERPSSQEIAVKREQLHVERLPTAEHESPGRHHPFRRTGPTGAREMTQSVVAVFESREQAETARQQLMAAGIPADRMSLHQGSESGAASDTSASARTSTAEETEGGIGHFFRSIFGLDDDRPAYYEDAARRGHVTLVADAPREEEVEQIRAILERFDLVDIDERATQLRSGPEGGRSERPLADRTARTETADPSSATIPVIEEDLQIGKREVERGRVRVYSRVMQRPVEESIQLREERARVTRQPANRPATEADFRAFKEGAVEIRETAEVPVVEKQARVVEEVQVGKQVEEHAETVRDRVRKTEVRVEEAPAASRSGKPRRGEKKTRTT